MKNLETKTQKLIFFFLITFVGSVSHAGILGFVGRVDSTQDGAIIKGWACDSKVNKSIDVHVYLGGAAGKGGTMLKSAVANVTNEAAVTDLCGTSKSIKHRFEIQVTNAQLNTHRGKSVYVHGISATHPNIAINHSGKFQLPNPPATPPVIGYVDQAKRIDSGFMISGWTCQKTISKSTNVHVYGANRKFVGSFPANKNREQAVKSACGSQISAHGFNFIVPESKLKEVLGQTLNVHGIRLEGNTVNSILTDSTKFKFPNQIALKLSDKIKNSSGMLTIKNEVVTIDTDANLNHIKIEENGTLRCDPSNKNAYTIRTSGIMIMGKGSLLECGTVNNRFKGKLTISLIKGMPMGHAGEAFISAMNQGVISLHGDMYGTRWTRLAQTAKKQADKLRFIDAINWKVGDTLAVAPTSFNMWQAETLTVKSIDSDKKGVTLNSKLIHDHLGVRETYPGKSLDYRAEVINLTRNIMIKTDGHKNEINKSKIGGHMMVMESAKAFISGVHFDSMGQMGELGRYPFHWHRTGDVSGQYIKDSSITNSFQRCLTVHMTQNALVQNNVCYNHFAHGFFLEDGNEINNKIIGNVAMLSKRVPAGRELLISDNRSDQRSRFDAPASFWISNPNNEVVGNVSAGSQGTGFWNAFVPYLNCSDTCEVVNTPGKANVFPAYQNTKRFDDNVSHTANVGFTWDGAPRGVKINNKNNQYTDHKIESQHYHAKGHDNPIGKVPVFKNLVTYKNIYTGLYYRGNRSEFRNLKAADNGVSLFIAFNQVFKNSLIVGKSKNSTTEEYALQYDRSVWKPKLLRGFITYDGPSELTDTTFAGFPSNQLFIGPNNTKEITPVPIHIFGGATHFEHQFKKTTFEGNPYYKVKFTTDYEKSGVNWADAINHVRIRDVDGSIYGRANEIIVPDFATNEDSTCRVLHGGRAEALGCKYEMGTIHFGRTDMVGANDKRYMNFRVQRNDKAIYNYKKSGTPALNNKMGVILDKDYEYKFNFDKSIIKSPGFSMESKVPGVLSPILKFNDNKNCSVNGNKVKVNSYKELVNYTGSQNAYFINRLKVIFVRLYSYAPINNTKGFNSDPIIITCP